MNFRTGVYSPPLYLCCMHNETLILCFVMAKKMKRAFRVRFFTTVQYHPPRPKYSFLCILCLSYVYTNILLAMRVRTKKIIMDHHRC